MKYAKLPVNLSAQIAILKKRGLRIISCFRFANYRKPMKAAKTAVC